MSCLPKYLIVYGDTEVYIQHAKMPLSESLIFTPFDEKVKQDFGSEFADPMVVLGYREEESVLHLKAFFKDMAALKHECDQRPESFLKMIRSENVDDHVVRYSLIGIKGKLYHVSVDWVQDRIHSEVVLETREMDFPDRWEIASVPVLFKDGTVKEVSNGLVKDIETVVFSGHLARFMSEKTGESPAHFIANLELLEALPFANAQNTSSLNRWAMLHEDAKFTFYKQKPAG